MSHRSKLYGMYEDEGEFETIMAMSKGEKMLTDITYCSRDCANINCVRNKKHTYEEPAHIWFCDFWWSNFEDCEEHKDE